MSQEKTLSGWQHMLLQNLCGPFSINGTFTDVTVVREAMGTNTPRHHHKCWVLNFSLAAIWTVIFLFSQEVMASMISEKNLKCGLYSHYSTLLYSQQVHVRWAAAFLDAVDMWISLYTIES